MVDYEKKKEKTIRILEKYNFNEKHLEEYRKAVEGENCVIDEVIWTVGEEDGEEEVQEFINFYGLKDLSASKDAISLENSLTWEESGM